MSRAAVASGLGSAITRGLSDGSLALRAANGDERAFAAIFDRHHQGLYRYCLVLVGNAQDAQDALQNTMIKVLLGLPGEERQIVLKPWLYRIAHNESIELLRRRREIRPLDPDLVATHAGLAEAATARERLRVLISDLDRLPERQRGALIMRELAGLDFAEIATALGTSAAVVRQTLYEARLSLRQMDEGREMSCESVTRALSDGDGRVARRRDLRSHLRICVDCRGFNGEIERREREFAALAPLPAAAAAGLLHGLLGGHGAAGGGFATALGGGAAKSLGVSVALKGAATVAVVAAIGVGAADRGGLIDVGLPATGHSRAIRVGPPAAAGLSARQLGHPGSAAARVTTGSPARSKGTHDSAVSSLTKPTSPPVRGEAGTPAEENAELTQPGEAGADQVASAGGGAKSNAQPAGAHATEESPPVQDAPASHPHGKDHEKQLPSASEHGQETAADHKAEGHGSGEDNHPDHPAQPSNPGAEKEAPPPSASPAAPESNGKGNGKGASPATGAEEAP